MHLTVNRYGHTENSTGGAFFIDGKFHAHTCEDQPQEGEKVYGETRIPAGCYEVKLRDVGGMNTKYHKRFSFHKGMLHIQEVPGFSWVYIHPLNNHKQSEGCIGVGYSAHSKGGFSISRSTEAYTDLYTAVCNALDAGEKVFITVNDEPVI